MTELNGFFDLNERAIEVWGEDAEAWMVVEENGELLEAFAKQQRGRATVEDVIMEAADSIAVATLAVTLVGGSQEDLESALAMKLARSRSRVVDAEKVKNDGE